MTKTLDEQQQFIELRAKGYSFSKIAEQLGVSKPTLISWSQDDKTNRDINNYRSLYLDELQEQYAMSKQHRIAAFGDVLAKAKAELNNRDLSTLPTDKLINLMIKLSDTLRRDELELELEGETQLLPPLGEPTRWKV